MGSFFSFLNSKKQKALLDLYEDECYYNDIMNEELEKYKASGKKPLVLRQYSLYEHIYE
jgi:hypothetical protein